MACGWGLIAEDASCSGGKGLCEVLLEEMSFQPSREDGGCESSWKVIVCLWVDGVCVCVCVCVLKHGEGCGVAINSLQMNQEWKNCVCHYNIM